jgi:hypothetical protein
MWPFSETNAVAMSTDRDSPPVIAGGFALRLFAVKAAN